MESRKYNRTPHLPYSPGCSKDDRIAESTDSLIGVPIVITEKLDGSNVCLETHNCFARTHSGPPKHASFDGLKAFHAQVKNLIPANVQVFGEWVYAVHSIAYDSLPGYLLIFGIRDLGDQYSYWHSWDGTEERAQELNLPTVPVLFKGTVSSGKELQKLTESLAKQPSAFGPTREGVVVRLEDSFRDEDFSKYVQKWVRESHVTTSTHWSHKEIIKNKLK